ncbi:flagellar biosynthesis protein FlhF [Paenibacillus antri]|uniref:Flagellar biosynthesis protein FlhF n=1 Tax=Paenibacillus antri TaxID=2582848 RepID=A0A5R9G6T6_9BACL|nr:flagellar biosynthesis protein FlhF [Paenibacillus antri]TLS49830.1 flagellar biosynthesis protein FlhF [Paenibacillus antri]
MKVKKYIVDSMPDALQKIRTELGKDAVIINTKEIRVGGFLGMFTKKKVEVVAATDSNPESAATARPAIAAARPATAAASSSLAGLSAPIMSPAPVAATRPATSVRPEPRPSFEAAAAATSPAPYAPAPAAPSGAKEDALLQEMKQMKEMMLRLAQAQTGTGAATAVEEALPPAFDAIRSRLVEQDVLSELAAKLVEDSILRLEEEGRPASELSAVEAGAAVKSAIVELLTKRPIEQIRQDARIVHFVGPTGVGKTTTIAKLAAEQTLKFRKSIGLITSDTYRIAAIEQLRTYASILNVPLEVVFSALDLQKALDRMQDRDMILMDTAGRNFRNEMAVSELQSLLRIEERKDTFLVLSLSMKYSDMKAVTDNFFRFGVEKVLFTKADETATLGSIVNLLHDFPLSLSYVTHGQNVPDDIHIADARNMADELVGEPHEE